MPPRLSKRQQQEQERLEALAAGPSKLESEGDLSGEDATITLAGSRGAVGFAALLSGDEKEQENESESDDKITQATRSKKSKKKKKKVSEVSANDRTKAKGKGKDKETSKSKAKLRAEEEAFDKALAELSGKYAKSHTGPANATRAHQSSFDAFSALLGVSLKHLDAEAELRRFFGSKVIASSETSSRTSRVRSNLAHPKPAWPSAQYRAGLSMRPLTAEEMKEKGTGVSLDTRERWWTIEASPRYKGTTYEYMQCVMGGDPQFFYNLIYEMPWHADTLLQMAEVFRHREEYATATDFTSRALFAYERAFSGAFNLTSGIHRLDFDRVENRVFYLTVARNIIDLNRRGTSRAAFEFARLLYALDPHTDPHGALLHLDYLAIRARQMDWVLGIWDAHLGMQMNKEGEVRFDVTILPGWCWARALALFDGEGEHSEEHQGSTRALTDAILAFPSIAPLLADKLDLNLPPDLRKIDEFKIVTDYSPYRDDLPTSLIHLLSHIYVLRSASLWKIPARANWLLKTLRSLTPSSFDLRKLPHARQRLQTLLGSHSNLTDAIYRHVIVTAPLSTDFLRLNAFLPNEVKVRMKSTIEGDPLPPVTSFSVYDDFYFSGVAVDTRRLNIPSPGERMADQIQGLFPNPVNREQLQDLFQAHPEIGARFPGGFVELAQLARQFPQEVFEAMIGIIGGDNAAQQVRIEEEGGGMPGGHGGLVPEGDEDEGNQENLLEDRESEEGDVDDTDGAIYPVRIVQNFLGRLWGRNTDAGDTNNEATANARAGEGPQPSDVD